jgi:hypothetical protein
MDIPVIQQAKIQAQVLVPLVKALQAELGEERANALVRKSLGDTYRAKNFGVRRTKTTSARLSRPRSRPMPAATRSIIASSSSRRTLSRST